MARWLVVLLGVALSVWMVSRSQVGGDQWNLLARGWLLAERHVWIQYGNPTSAGGDSAGGATSLVVGLPLLVWPDVRSPALLTALCHFAAFLLLDLAAVRILGRRGRLVFAVVYWLNPWRLYFSGHLWNPNFLFLAGAAHFWTADRLRARGLFWTSAAHIATIGFAFQLHPSAIILALASALLVVRRDVRLHAAGAAVGTVLVALSLAPWVRAALAAPEILPGDTGFLGRGLVTVFPVVRGLLYLLRYGSLSVPAPMTALDFTAMVGPEADGWLTPAVVAVIVAIGTVSVVPSFLAHVWFIRKWRRAHHHPTPSASAARATRWSDRYCAAVLAAAFVSFLAAPTTVMFWQAFVVFHVPVLMLARWLTVVGRTRRAVLVRRGLAVGAAFSIVMTLAAAAGARHYRCGGRDALGLVVGARYPMIDDLDIDAACPVRVDPVTGWTPDVFRPARNGRRE